MNFILKESNSDNLIIKPDSSLNDEPDGYAD